MKLKSVICLALSAAILVVYWQVGNNAFINFDDPGYLYENHHVLSGLSLENVRWAFATLHMSNWHPLTWLSHMTDCQLFGVNPGWHHLSGLLLHLLNTLLLFLFLNRVTGAIWRSAFVAAFFALHPLHVETVAWAAERKDLLSTFFWMLTMQAYAWYVERPGWRRYLSVLSCFILGLMAKPMLVTLPFILLLFDYWPFGRIHPHPAFGHPLPEGEGIQCPSPLGRRGGMRENVSLIVEKLPLLALAAVSCIITIYAQQQGGAVSSLETVPLQLRVANALVAWWGYIGKMFWPVNLAFLYPLERDIPTWGAITAGILLLGVSLAVVRGGRKCPYLPVGWLWYLVSLVPVIGIVQVGLQSMADRYTYIPLIGLFIMIAWGVPDLLKNVLPRYGIPLTAASLISLILLAGVTWRQVGYWKNSVVLFTHAVAVTPRNVIAHNNLGTALAAQGRIDEAIGHFQDALAINPDYADAHYNLANQLSELHRMGEAVAHYRSAVQLKPDHPEAQNNLGIALAMTGQREESIARFSEAVRLKPEYMDAHYNLGVAFLEQGRIEEAAAQFTAVLHIQPGHADARRRLDYALSVLKGTMGR